MANPGRAGKCRAAPSCRPPVREPGQLRGRPRARGRCTGNAGCPPPGGPPGKGQTGETARGWPRTTIARRRPVADSGMGSCVKTKPMSGAAAGSGPAVGPMSVREPDEPDSEGWCRPAPPPRPGLVPGRSVRAPRQARGHARTPGGKAWATPDQRRAPSATADRARRRNGERHPEANAQATVSRSQPPGRKGHRTGRRDNRPRPFAPRRWGLSRPSRADFPVLAQAAKRH